MSLADAMQETTRLLHARAERSGIVAALIAGRATMTGYLLLLRNLLPAYEALEAGLMTHVEEPGIDAIARPEVFRAESIRHDLRSLHGCRFDLEIPLLDDGACYAERVCDTANRGPPCLLAAHAYTRYLGDLSGGRILARRLERTLGIDRESLRFFEFSTSDLDGLRRSYRHDIDRIEVGAEAREAVLEEARVAFRLNIALSEAVLAALPEQSAAAPRLPARDLPGPKQRR